MATGGINSAPLGEEDAPTGAILTEITTVIVDDEEAIRNNLEQATVRFAALMNNPTLFENGLDALMHLRHTLNDIRGILVIITDNSMPKMNGLTLLEAVLRMFSELNSNLHLVITINSGDDIGKEVDDFNRKLQAIDPLSSAAFERKPQSPKTVIRQTEVRVQELINLTPPSTPTPATQRQAS